MATRRRRDRGRRKYSTCGVPPHLTSTQRNTYLAHSLNSLTRILSERPATGRRSSFIRPDEKQPPLLCKSPHLFRLLRCCTTKLVQRNPATSRACPFIKIQACRTYPGIIELSGPLLWHNCLSRYKLKHKAQAQASPIQP